MWFKPKAEAVQSDFKSEDVWSALQSQRGLEQQRRYILELESQFNASKAATRVSILGLSIVVIFLALVTAWNTYQIQQWQPPTEATSHQNR